MDQLEKDHEIQKNEKKANSFRIRPSTPKLNLLIMKNKVT